PKLHSIPTRRSSDLQKIPKSKVYSKLSFIKDRPQKNKNKYINTLPEYEPGAFNAAEDAEKDAQWRTKAGGGKVNTSDEMQSNIRSEEHTSELQSRFD